MSGLACGWKRNWRHIALTPELWNRIREEFDRAAELPPENQAEFLKELRQRDP